MFFPTKYREVRNSDLICSNKQSFIFRNVIIEFLTKSQLIYNTLKTFYCSNSSKLHVLHYLNNTKIFLTFVVKFRCNWVWALGTIIYVCSASTLLSVLFSTIFQNSIAYNVCNCSTLVKSYYWKVCTTTIHSTHVSN